jgi:hypothetical protein
VRLRAISIVSNISGGASNPLTTAAHYSARIGSIGARLIRMPPSVASAITP